MKSLALSAALIGSPALAAQPAQQSSVALTIAHPVTVTKLADMDFGILSLTAAGTAVLDPNTDALSRTGGVNVLGGAAHAAHFRITATRLALVFIQTPAAAATLTRLGGTESMSLSNWTLTGFPIRILGAQGTSDFGVGGTLQVGAGQAEGTYVGTFDVTVDYF